MFKDQSNFKTAPKHRKGIIRLHIIPLLVWLCAVGCVVFLFSRRIQRFEVVGMAHSKTFMLSAETTGRIKTMDAELFDPVKKGQVITRLDSELLEAEFATVKAETSRLKAELAAEKDRFKIDAHDRMTDFNARYRSFAADVEIARLRVLELKSMIEPDRILLKDYQAEIDIELQLRVNGATNSTYNIEKAQAQYDTLARKIEENQKRLEQAKVNIANAIKRRDEFLETQKIQPSPDAALEAISKSINVQQQLMNELTVQSKSLVLKSPADGIITEITQRAGEVVTPGTVILTIAEAIPTEVIAYASESGHSTIKPNQKVELVKTGAAPQVARSQIVQVGPAIDMVPERLQNHPDMPQWGRPFMVKIPPGMELVPGEKVGIRGLSK